jgi:hypothetical protein
MILYEDVCELTSKLVRRRYFRVVAYENHEVTFKSHATQDAAVSIQRIRALKQIWAADLNQPTELMQVGAHIAGLLANRMKARMALGESVTWVREAYLLSEGAELEFAGRSKAIAKMLGWLGAVRLRSDGLEIERSRTPAELIRWNQLERVDHLHGVFHLWRCGEPKSILKLRPDLPNLLAGVMVILDYQRGEPTHVHPHVLTIL